MDPKEVVSAIKRALMEEGKKFIACHVVDAETRLFDRYLVRYADGGYETMVVETTDQSTRESVMEDVKGHIVGDMSKV